MSEYAVLATGVPQAIASSTTFGKPSCSEVTSSTSLLAISSGTSRRWPTNWTYGYQAKPLAFDDDRGTLACCTVGQFVADETKRQFGSRSTSVRITRSARG